MNILVTGGLGFIGSHTVVSLQEAGYNPVILDNLSNSDLCILRGIEKITGKAPAFFNGDVTDIETLNLVFNEFDFSAVIHFAALKAVGESVDKPLEYYQNNVGGMIALLQVMKTHHVNMMVFSSSCTVYGEPITVPVTENEPVKPANSPYGATKQMCETILRDNPWCKTQCLRYFNPVGAHPSGNIGELPLGIPNNLVPYITQTAIGKRQMLTVNGGDYPTRDGTCIRDYIHVMDLAEAHLACLGRMLKQEEKEVFEVFNIGTGTGCTVLEVIHSFENTTGIKIPFKIGPRRAGDVVAVWADCTRVNRVLGWNARYGLDDMMRDAWNWQKNADSLTAE